MRKAFVTDVDRIYNSGMKASVVSEMAKCRIILEENSTGKVLASYANNPSQVTIPNVTWYVKKVKEGGPVLMHELVHYYNKDPACAAYIKKTYQ